MGLRLSGVLRVVFEVGNCARVATSWSVLACSVLFLTLPSADAAVVPDYQLAGTALFNLSPPGPLYLNDFGSISLMDPRFGSLEFTASGTPSPSLIANASVGLSSIPGIYGDGSGVLTYFFQIVGSQGTVPLLVDVAGELGLSIWPSITWNCTNTFCDANTTGGSRQISEPNQGLRVLATHSFVLSSNLSVPIRTSAVHGSHCSYPRCLAMKSTRTPFGVSWSNTIILNPVVVVLRGSPSLLR